MSASCALRRPRTPLEAHAILTVPDCKAAAHVAGLRDRPDFRGPNARLLEPLLYVARYVHVIVGIMDSQHDTECIQLHHQARGYSKVSLERRLKWGEKQIQDAERAMCAQGL